MSERKLRAQLVSLFQEAYHITKEEAKRDVAEIESEFLDCSLVNARIDLENRRPLPPATNGDTTSSLSYRLEYDKGEILGETVILTIDKGTGQVISRDLVTSVRRF